ncbi:DUF4349 domain-containing protein [Psychrobacter sp. FME5]|uniref:DUF4349 domain-containing protein n=1 Tax=unclassified Psychrobacter TaxID=196806 RepID=UPI001787ECA2|nr:DUF4349 domain-containing protein [Psychrobacter sp. FME5]MBE0444281.1 DUF4349 domain-containing protein [Psychrobacter sp. FME5]
MFLSNTSTISHKTPDYKIMTQGNQNKSDTPKTYSRLTTKSVLSKAYSQDLFLPAAFLPVMLGSVLLISGCDKAPEYAESRADMTEVVTEEVAAATESEMVGMVSDVATDDLQVQNLSNGSEQTLGSQTADIQIAGKKLLITASANFKVKDVVKSSNAIESLTRQQGGYVALSHINNYPDDRRTFVQGDKNITITTYTRQADMTVRIPRVNVNKFLDQVQQQVAFLNEQQFSAQDVTLDIYREQLASQLSSDMASELSAERLNSKNDKEQTSNVDAISATYAARRQQELAKLEQLAIADKVKYSSISLTFKQPDVSYKEITKNLDVLLAAERPSFGAQVSEAFREGWGILRSFTLGLIQLWWLLVLGGVFYLIYRLIKMLYRKRLKNEPRLKNMKGERMDKKQTHQYSTDIENSRAEISNTKPKK